MVVPPKLRVLTSILKFFASSRSSFEPMYFVKVFNSNIFFERSNIKKAVCRMRIFKNIYMKHLLLREPLDDAHIKKY